VLDVNQLIYNGGLLDANAKSKKRKPKRSNNKPKSTYTNSNPESISCISRPFYKTCYFDIKQEQLDSKIKEVELE
jgi:hypothetical protein